MTELFKKAVERASEEFADHEQDEFARWLLHCLESDDDRRWDAALRDPTNHKLSELVNQALADIREGRTEPLDLKKL